MATAPAPSSSVSSVSWPTWMPAWLLCAFVNWLSGVPWSGDRACFLAWLCGLAEQDQDERLRQELRQRERALFQEHGPRWIEPLRDVCSQEEYNYSPWFRRGMIEYILLSPHDLLTHADRIFRFPVRN